MGHNVSVLTGTHDYTKKSKERMISAPITGGDIYIEKGVWLGSNSTILGPCRIGENSVIAAGSIVTKDIPNNVLVGGIPARIIKQLQN
jgi:acetyltransferase-like isoleucine patch superfamily enzyme